MNGIEGVPLTHDPRRFTDAPAWHKPYRIEETTHRAFPEPVALALVAVAEAAETYTWATHAVLRKNLKAALNALAEAQASK